MPRRPNQRAAKSSSQSRPYQTSAIWWRAGLIALAVVAVYANSLSGPFLFDDEASIVENRAIRSFGSVLSERANSPLAGRPVVGFTFALNYALHGFDVTGYHLTNIAIHVCSALLLFGFVRRTIVLGHPNGHLFAPYATDFAAAVALIWAVHPLNTEAVNYVTQRTELLFGFFYLLVMYSVARSHSSIRVSRWHVLAVVSCALGMASKESMVTAPLIVLLYDRVFMNGSWREMFSSRSRVYFYAALMLTWLVLAVLVIPGPRASSAGFSAGVSVWTYLLNQAVIIGRYLRLAVWPSGFVMNYGPPLSLTLQQVLPQALFVIALLSLTLTGLALRPAVGFIGAWIFITLAPSSSILPIATEVGAERRMYLPLMAIVTAFVLSLYAIGVRRSWLKGRAVGVLLGSIVVLFAAITAARNLEYRSALSVAELDVRRWPSNYTRGALGGELVRLGEDEKAIPELRIGARTGPRARYNLGVALFNTKRYDEAIRELETLVAEHPWREEVPWARRIIGHAYAMQGRWAEAIVQFRMVLAMTPYDVETRRLLVDALNKQGVELGGLSKHDEAISVFHRAIDLDPKSPVLRHNLATALLDKGDLAGAAAEAERAIALNPTDAGLYDLLGRALAMQGKYRESIAQLERAAALDPGNAVIQDDLRKVQATTRTLKRQDP